MARQQERGALQTRVGLSDRRNLRIGNQQKSVGNMTGRSCSAALRFGFAFISNALGLPLDPGLS